MQWMGRTVGLMTVRCCLTSSKTSGSFSTFDSGTIISLNISLWVCESGGVDKWGIHVPSVLRLEITNIYRVHDFRAAASWASKSVDSLKERCRGKRLFASCLFCSCSFLVGDTLGERADQRGGDQPLL